MLLSEIRTNQFRIRISPSLRGIGSSQLIGTKDYLEIEFIGWESITVFYPSKIENLPEAVESQFLLKRQLSNRNVDNIKYYVKDYLYDIDRILKVML